MKKYIRLERGVCDEKPKLNSRLLLRTSFLPARETFTGSEPECQSNQEEDINVFCDKLIIEKIVNL